MEILDSLWQLLVDIGRLLAALGQFGLRWWLLLLWLAWWTCAVDWRKAWPALRQGAWAPVLLLIVMAALAWSRLDARPLPLGFTTVGNFWWQLGAVSLFAASALVCGWVQGLIRSAPPEMNLDPPAATDQGHGHH